LFQLIPFAYKIAGIHSQYKEIHTLVVGDSLRSFIFRLFKKVDYAQCVTDLALIKDELAHCKKEFCSEENLKLNAAISQDILHDMCHYIQALLETVEQLRLISSHHCNSHDKNKQLIQYRQNLVNYDDSIQTYKRIGIRLNYFITKK
jgi:hypothetical protein